MKCYLPEDFPNKGDFIPEKYKTIVYYTLIWCSGKHIRNVVKRNQKYDFGEYVPDFIASKVLGYILKDQDTHLWYNDFEYYVVDKE